MKRVALAFLASVSVAQAQVNPPSQPLLQELQLPFTGKNGYEEYLMAADTTRTPAMKSFFRWRSFLETGLLGNEPGAAPTTPRPADLRDPLSLLTLRQASVTRIAPALDLIRRGNQKAVFSPHPEMKGELLFPELAEFRNLARLGVDAMYAHSAMGASERSVETFAQLRLLSDNLSNLSLIHFLVGMACESLLVNAAYRNRATWSLTDAGRVALVCEAVLNREPAIARAAKGEHLLAFRFISEGLAGPESLAELIEFQIEREVPNEAERALIQRLRRLTPPEMNALRARVLAKSEENLAKALKILAGAEKDWVSQLQALEGPSIEVLPTIRDEATLFELIAGYLTDPISKEAANACIFRRTQTRILRLYAKATTFRWINDRWPKVLSEFTTLEEQRDPVNDGAFVFNRPTDDSIEIYSNGTKETGRIDVTRVAQRFETSQNSGLP